MLLVLQNQLNNSELGAASAAIISQETGSLAAYFPSGNAWAAKDIPGTVFRLFLEGIASEFGRGALLDEEIRSGIIPDRTTMFIDEWERALGIPDDCFEGRGTDEERRLDIVTKLASLGVQTAEDFVELAAIQGVECTISQNVPLGTFTYTFEAADGGLTFGLSEREIKFTIVVTFLNLPLGVTFPYQFPMPFLTRNVSIVQCLFEKLKPANCAIQYRA